MLRAGHPGEPRAPDAAGDDDRFRLDVAFRRTDSPDPAALDVDPEHLDAGRDGERAVGRGLLPHEGSGAQRVDDADARRIEAAEDHGLVDEGDELLDLGGRQE